ncbi:hypothetical protein EDD16DRAFT_1684937 [Pisolithus croceorrhizus]|nr:hypothetical protein EDD16DRAFT_1684937 [Pisolithus croceorrhizus]
MSFARISQEASRRAAASGVWGTRDCIKLTQSAAFENIKIQAKPSFGARRSLEFDR